MNLKAFLVIAFEALLMLSLICSGSLSEFRPTVLMPSNPGAVSVCPGENLHLICSANRSFIEWNITALQSDSGQTESRTRLVSDISPISMLIVNGISFVFTRNSSLRSRPLTSTASVANVTADLNGFKVSCTSIEHSTLERESSTITIHVIQADISQPQPPESITTHVIHYEADNVLVMLDWIPQEGVSYNVTTIPRAAIVLTANTSVQLALEYNTQYNVSILATSCEQSFATIIDHDLKFTQCSFPLVEELGVLIMEYSNPALEGASVTFGCPSGMVLVGSNTATCMENGQWNLDPANVACRADCQNIIPDLANASSIFWMYNSTLEGSLLIFWCEDFPNNVFTALCHRNASWYPNPADVDCSNLLSPTELTGISNQSQELFSYVNMQQIIIASSLGSICGVITIFIGIAATSFFFIKSQGSWCGKKEVSTVCDHVHNPNTSQFDCEGEYSLIQYVPTQSTDRASTTEDETIRKEETLLYADVGAISFTPKPCISVSIDDERVEYSQVNFNAPKDTPSVLQNFQNADDMLNLDSLLFQVKADVTSQWYQLGEALGVDKSVLEKCTHYPPEESIIEVLDSWLRNHLGQPTWREIAQTLKIIGLHQLGCDIEKVYKTGKLPKDVNMDETPKHIFSELEIEQLPPLPPRLEDS